MMQTGEAANQSSVPSQRISAVLRLTGLHLEVGGTRMNSEWGLVTTHTQDELTAKLILRIRIKLFTIN